MQKPTSKEGTGRWICCYWEEKFFQLDIMPRQEGFVSSGILYIPPPVEDITFHDGLWSELNYKLGTLFDVAEEEDVSPDLLPQMDSIIANFVKQHYSGATGMRVVQVGLETAPQPRLVIAQMPLIELRLHLQRLSKFVAEAARQGKVISVSL